MDSVTKGLMGQSPQNFWARTAPAYNGTKIEKQCAKFKKKQSSKICKEWSRLQENCQLIGRHIRDALQDASKISRIQEGLYTVLANFSWVTQWLHVK